MKTDILVIGAGPVGLFTVFEAGILGLKCTLIDNLDKPGGQCAELYPDKPIFDIPGVPYQTAQEHVNALLKQIEPFEYDLILNERVESMTKKNDLWEVSTNKGTNIETPNIFIAAGAGSFEPIKPNLECDFSALEGKKYFIQLKIKLSLKNKRLRFSEVVTVHWTGPLNYRKLEQMFLSFIGEMLLEVHQTQK